MQRRGFTLIEVAVAVAILAGALMLAAPALPRLRVGNDAAAHALVDALEHGRLRAAREGRFVTVDLDPDRGRVAYSTPDLFGVDSLLEVTPLELAGARLEPDSAAPGLRAWLSPLGRAAGGPYRLSFGDRTSWVFVDPWTGRPRAEP